MMEIKIILVLSLSLGLSSAQLIQSGQCDPNIQLQANFNVTEFFGTWYEVRRAANTFQTSDCSYLEIEDGDGITLYNRAVNNNFLEETRGNGTLENGTARFTFTIDSNAYNFWILSTDYTNFAIAYACENRGTTERNVYIWQLGRASSFPTDMMEALMNQTLITTLGTTVEALYSLDHSVDACRTLPDIPAGQPVILPGQCNPNMSVVQNFNVTQFMGVWHQISSYYSDNGRGTCNRAEYTLSGSMVDVVNSQVVNQTLNIVAGNATLTTSDNSARLLVTLEVVPNVYVQSPLWILATDYTSYAVSYTCTDLPNNERRVNTWILSRSRQITEAAQAAVNQVIRSEVDLNSRFLIPANQSDNDCFYLRDPVPGQSVTFRGQCDPDVRVLQNFDAQRFMGLWHNIETYPSTFQGGSCSNAYYTLVNGTVDVFNTQVVDQRLDTINGVATVTATDGSAKLSVNFPIVGTNLTISTDYWVLDTDYDSYAFVYSCSNLENDERQINSWKLSRRKVMPTNGTLAINAIIDTIPVLNQQYFENVDQSVDGCFYFPEPQPGVPVRFPGQCENINVTQNFDLSRFQGTWYEIQAYPKDQQPGHCISHAFSLSGNNFTLVTSSVNDQFQIVSNSNVTINSADESAKMIITINANGQEIQIPYWIVDTDYNNYALAYSCVNVDEDYRMVYSWKLSRTRQLSSASVTAINTTMSNVTVLEERYFETVHQTDVACFYLPEIPAGQPIILNGQCDQNIRAVQNFNATGYLGRWRLVESYGSDFQTGTCNEATYSLSNGTVLVYNTQVINQTLNSINGSATVASNDGSGRLLVTFPGAPAPIEYWILDTDYTSYSLVYSCTNLNTEQRRVWSWKLSRTRDLTPTAIENMNRIINTIEVLNNRYYELLDQSDSGCFYYPSPGNSPVTFRGQCDPNINVVTNFNATAYMNLWHDVSSYPSGFQEGTCNNAFYTLVGGTVDVFNTQVIDQRLDTIRGTARLAGTDGSGRLIVDFPIAGTNLTAETPYWVLATDYESYALVYSCINIDDEQRQVWSWKLSRSKVLPAAANNSINAVINTVPVLDNRYYIDRDQSREGCFYFPEPTPGVPVVFPGQCDETIQAVPNFNMSLFQGIWHEIEAYPKDQQTGQCVNHEYTLNTTNVLELVSSNVINQILGFTNSRVTFQNATDNSGKLDIVLTTGQSVITIPFWIISTDYNNYALAYSCVNLNEDFRGVYSWKLSRTKQLRPVDATAINNAMTNINVLENRYFESIDQSDNACFYLPDPVPGEPVVFIGQCDPNIPVMQNFEPARYLGRWRLIQSYPERSQVGTCIEANYSLNPDNSTVDVYNTQVIGQELSTINGTAVLASNDGSGRLLVYFPQTTVPAEYWILDTDYDSYALVYGCNNLDNNQRRVTSWKLSRTNQLTPNATERINQIVNSINVLNNQYYANIDRSDQACFYYPVPDGTPVVFRGQCDPNIPVVTNFNATAYMGLWHDIASYTSGFQGGTCNNAFYTLSGDTVDVFNTQVIDQSLDTITGVARLASTDGTARLIVDFPVAGTNLTIETPYWVLATDYLSYALVYTCINLDFETRQVWSWKLSRSKELSAAANVTINSVINTIPVLDDRYYEIKNQTDEGCFYFPEPRPGVPVVFPGQCDENIQAVPNFNMSQFIGVWHEIETYPKEQQTGECISHSYSLSTANILNLMSSSIRNETMNITTSTVSFQNATESSGRLLISLISGGFNITIPFWILSTDYTDYALAYSCVNLENSSRAVYSWKLSRSKQLSAAGIAAINSTIETVEVLENRYYEPVDQSDRACFYLPDVVPGQPALFPGQCDSTIPVVQNFNATAYAGRWRMIETYISDFQSQQGTCADATYTLTGGAVAVTNTQVINQVLDVTTGSATLATTDGQAKLLVTFPNAPVADYWVLSTDYDSYALVYSCLNVSTDQRRVWTWKLSRTRDLTAAAVTEIDRVVNTIDVLNERYYTRIDHSDNSCFYYPTPNGEPVEFRGQCDLDIPVVSNFNVTAYLGLWYDIAAYPTSFQGGTCENAEYSLGDGVVDVFNTQVINQTLNTIIGNARLNTTDGQAKLIVNFPIAGTNLTSEAPYWVLATDYTSFSLVYSCVNIDTERRRISSWMLSRTKELPVAANNSINAVINTVPVLDNRYYDIKDQTDEGCFYFPEPLPGVPVVFPGQCDQSVQAVANFNMSAFVGVWYETETYPKEQQTGECVSHTYSQSTGNVLELVSSSIRNEMLNETSSRVSFESAQDSSGRLIITLTSGGSTITIPFWILSTDYTDYALAYSCVNLEQNTRAVYSWKLSRSRVLSAAGAVAINNRINSVVVLDNRYYEPVDQSDRACFYLPELTPGQPVVFPGQCNPNITVVQNFNATAYAGRWRMIETYISDFQSQQGTCADATYTLTGSTVAVSNTQVINQVLDVTIGSATLATTDGQAKLLVTFPNAPEADYWVLSTDYTSYALVYSCRNINEEQRRVWTWKLSRTRELTAAAVTEIDRVVNTIDVLNERYYTRVDHSDNGCFYYPTPDGEPVQFRGQCDMNIPVVTNFNVTAYTGTWYDIQSYPVRFQDGTCPTATYTLGSTGVDVYNTQVVGQQLDTINGVAELASTDGSARLNVTFPVAGTNFTITTSYWVLATDYNNYALVYSCDNINEEYRNVRSWKLSRTTSLTQASVTAINNVINTIPVLRQDYYVTRGHTEADCFFYPDNNGGPVIREGQCDLNNLNVTTNFNAAAFTGSWYEISRYPSELQEGECVTKEFSIDQQFNMRKNFVYNERMINLSGPATLATDGRGVINVNLTGAGGEVFSTTYYVLDVEYNDFALFYGCRNYNTSHAQVYSWKLSRTQTLSNTAIARINTIVNNTLDLFEGYYEETDNTPTGCFHYPVFDELPTSIELIGTCDESITAKANFNVTAYLGVWYETASYPQAFQSGLCARAQYSLGTNGVDVLNSQVVNSTLEIQTASAVVASNDGTGLLDVTFVLSNGIINVVRYYVLETDYNSFSLVYSCRNLPNGNRTVSSWKLSRTTTLPQQAEPIINTIIANTQGLINEYYRPTSQTEEACFYIPEVNKNEAPQFRGRCENIQGVQNFDAQRYLGWWHEIESYPTDNDKGTCVSSDISQIGNEFIVTDTNVFGTTAQVNSSTVTISSNGRLRKTYSDGQIVDLWVLATDYDNYALLYSCENIGTEYMRVWSAKHSKSRQLSQAAQNAMEPFIQNTRTLETQFYQPVDQSDSACFHYPEPTGDQIILPGQCDENIPIVQNFSPVEYSGTWYQVERYPQLFENGTCVGARYTLNENTGVVDVTNWQVVGDVLDVVEGTATVNSTDGSAMLIVRLPIRHTEDIEPVMVSMRLYVLTTDYLSYSLAYSCENVGPYRRAVGAWKLSRTRTMSTAGDAAINTFMNSREELHQPYFLQVEQNEDCDEPSNAIIFKSSIIIMIVCSILHLLL